MPKPFCLSNKWQSYLEMQVLICLDIYIYFYICKDIHPPFPGEQSIMHWTILN